MSERYVDALELAATLGVHPSTVKRWVKAGCPSETWGIRVRRFRVSEVAAWARERRATMPGAVPSGAVTPLGRIPTQEVVHDG